ncbi:MAG: hypothetical protein ACM3KL_09080 [Alphaproteobacteria bacterium]
MSQKPRIVFLIPIASARRAKDWKRGCAYFEQTLSSVFNSRNGNYCVVVAGHEPPTFQLPQDPRLKFLSLGHPLPSREGGYYPAAVKDKLIKLEAAWNYAKSTWNPQYVMKLDWDDLISSRLVDWLVSAKNEPGYLIKHGWIWRSHAPYLIQRTEYFDRGCGSCLIIRTDLADQTGPFLTEVEGVMLDEPASRFAIADHYSLVPGSGITTLLLNDTHQRYAAQFGYLGQRLATIPFRAAVCRIDHGNNAGAECPRMQTVRMVLGRIRRTRLITRGLRNEFMLP